MSGAQVPLEQRRFIVEVRIAGRWRRLSSPSWKGYGGVSLLKPGRGRYGTFDHRGVVGARAWIASKRYVTGRRVTMLNPYPNLVLDGDTGWPAPALCRKLQRIGARLGRRLKIREGTRSHERQREFWREFEARGFRPPLVARPGTSNHEDHDGDGYGEAADVGVLRAGESTGNLGVNLGDHPGARAAMRDEETCLPVPGETWHVEEGNRWAA